MPADLTTREQTPLTVSAPVPPPAKPSAPFRKTARVTVWIACTAVVTVIVLFPWHRRVDNSSWTFATADRGNIESTVMTSGWLNAVITVQVGSQVSGNIIALHADFNTKVKKGQLIAEIDTAPFQAALDQATATVAAANEKSARDQVDVTIRQLDQAKAVIRQGEAVLAQARLNLSHTGGMDPIQALRYE